MVAALNYKTPFLFQKNVSGAPFSQDFTSPSRAWWDRSCTDCHSPHTRPSELVLELPQLAGPVLRRQST